MTFQRGAGEYAVVVLVREWARHLVESADEVEVQFELADVAYEGTHDSTDHVAYLLYSPVYPDCTC